MAGDHQLLAVVLRGWFNQISRSKVGLGRIKKDTRGVGSHPQRGISPGTRLKVAVVDTGIQLGAVPN